MLKNSPQLLELIVCIYNNADFVHQCAFESTAQILDFSAQKIVEHLFGWHTTRLQCTCAFVPRWCFACTVDRKTLVYSKHYNLIRPKIWHFQKHNN